MLYEILCLNQNSMSENSLIFLQNAERQLTLVSHRVDDQEKLSSSLPPRCTNVRLTCSRRAPPALRHAGVVAIRVVFVVVRRLGHWQLLLLSLRQ